MRPESISLSRASSAFVIDAKGFVVIPLAS